MLRNVAMMTLIVLAFTTGGCMVVQSPVLGLVYTDAKYGDTATGEAGANKEGQACARSILGLVAEGDASIATAKAKGGITQVSSVDHKSTNLLGIIGEWCTVVKGR
jgi:hypothetical protein